MLLLHSVSYFFGGIFLANSVPHLVSGMLGRAFKAPSPSHLGWVCRPRR
jgi:hypothetical protein